MNLAALIREIGRGPEGSRDLAEQAAFELYLAMLDGVVPELELGAILIALRVKGEGLDELLGFHWALKERLATLEPPPVAVAPVLLPSYNGARHQANLTPLLALLLARFGIPVLLHSAADVHGRVGTAAVLAALDIPLCRDLREAQARLDAGEIAHVSVDLLAPGLAALLATRKRIGLRSSAHSLAKLIDPFQDRALRVVSVSHPDYLDRMARFLGATHAHALLLRGTEGEPFANPKRRPRIEHYRDGERTVLFDAEVGPIPSLPTLPAAIDAATTADWIRKVLQGRLPLPLPLVNQLACCLYGAGSAATLAEAKALAALRAVGFAAG
jgi:anthranilate phosphoribosyltransferase